MTEQPVGEKEEKAEEKAREKEMEKQDEKRPEEKSWDEKYRRDPLGSIIWAIILIWVGVVFLLSNLGMLDRLLHLTTEISGIDELDKFLGTWPVILIGMGVILLVEVLIRLLVPAYRRPVTGTFILAIIFLALGMGDLVSWNLLWPLVLIGLGVSFLLRGVFRKR